MPRGEHNLVIDEFSHLPKNERKSKRAAKRRRENIDKSLERERKYTETHREQKRKSSLEFKKRHPLKNMYWNAVFRARKLDVPFTLKFEDLVVPDSCPILGIKLQFNTGELKNNSPTLDRIVPELGYTKTNSKIISHKANRLKSNMNRTEIQKLLDYIDGKL